MATQRLEVPFEVRWSADQPTRTVEGYGSVFGNVDAYGDVVAPGAFAQTLAEAKSSGVYPAMLSQHGGLAGGDPTPVGVWTSLAEDERGLKVAGQLADTPRGQEIYALLKMQPRPALSGLSIGFRALEWAERSKPDEPRRTLKAVKLYEISFVTFPANDRARVTDVKTAIDQIETLADVEEVLRDAGFSRRDACALVSRTRMLAVAAQRDAADVEAVKAAARRLLQSFA